MPRQTVTFEKISAMKNTTMLKNILQLYRVSLDMDDEGNFHLTVDGKGNNNTEEFIDKSYTIVIGKAFAYMKKQLKASKEL
jgi:hypothetical protein